MKSRFISGAAGLAVIVFVAAWPQILRTDAGTTVVALVGYFGIMLGVYLLFYSMTGEWLPKYWNRKRKG